MKKQHISIILLILAALAGGVFAWQSQESAPVTAQVPPVTAPATPAAPATPLVARQEELDFVIGSASAPVTIIEYASLTCPHCARFHTDVLSRLKEKYVETGKVRFVFRDFPLDRLALNAAMLARCNGAERFFSYLDVYFAEQANWTRGTPEQAMAALRRLTRTGGMSEQAIDACLANVEIQNAVLTQAMTGEREHRVQSTPTLVINGQTQRGAPTFDELERLLQPLVK